jgi:hypothetical protein
LLITYLLINKSRRTSIRRLTDSKPSAESKAASMPSAPLLR